jgi:hypothetical protein
MDSKDNPLSNDDSHKRALKLAKAPVVGLVKGLVEELENIPGAAIVKNVFNESSEALVKYFSQVKKDISKERLFEFYNIVFIENVSEDKRKELLESFDKIKDEEHLRFIEMVMRDEETEKVEYYAKLFRVFLEKDFSRVQKTHHLQAFRSLRSYDFQLLKQYYEILKEMNRGPRPEMNSFQMLPSPKNKLEALASEKDAVIASGIQRLTSAGYVIGASPSASIYEISEVLD